MMMIVPLALFLAFFALTALMIFRGFRRTSRLHGKIFDLAERRIDEQLEQAQAGPRSCEYCDASVPSQSSKCANCGAPV